MKRVGAISLKTAEWIGLLVVALLFVFPFLWMASTAFKTMPEVRQFPPSLLPESWEWSNFVRAWESGPFLMYTVNSILVAVGILVLQFLTAVPAAYAFARYRFPGRNLLFGLVLVVLMIPGQVIFCRSTCN